MTNRFLGTLLAAVVGIGAHGAAPLAAADGWVNVTGNLSHKLSECGNLSVLAPVPGSDTILAGVALRGLWANGDGKTWSRLGEGEGSDQIINRPSWIVYDPQDPMVFWESGTYNSGGVYKTIDGGQTFRRLGTITHNDYVSVDLTDPERRTLLAGGHEQSQTVHASSDGGLTWTNIGATLPPGSNTSHPLVVNSRIYLVDATSGQFPGIYRSRDGGAGWQRVSTVAPNAPPLYASNAVIYWAANGAILRSVDYGSTWTPVGTNLRAVRPVELPGGAIVAVGETTLMISNDGGARWSPLGPVLPYAPSGLIFSPERKAFFLWRSNCGDEVLRDAVMMFSIDDPATAAAAPPVAPAAAPPAASPAR
jgi:photosystem II stability/assembly factor-like uncharacterized protein